MWDSARPVDPVQVDGLPIADQNMEQVCDSLINLFQSVPRKTITALAVHVGALAHLSDPTFRAAIDSADLVYADGASLVLLAWLWGARSIRRSPTTDLAPELLDRLRDVLGRSVRVALIGGPPGLSERAARELERTHSACVVLKEHGYHDDWTSTLSALGAALPDLVFVGLGAPIEHEWVYKYRALLPESIVLTCGGWFGFLASHERRAPMWMRRWGLEWFVRLVQSPRRLWRRYIFGGCKVVPLGIKGVVSGRRK